LLQLRERDRHRALAGIDHDLPPGADPVHVFSSRFANPAFDPVSNDGPTQRARAREPDLHASLSIISQAEGGKQRPGELGAMIVYSAEILGAQDSRALREAGDSVTSRR